jgi:peptidoglycan-associated lipoprotein
MKNILIKLALVAAAMAVLAGCPSTPLNTDSNPDATKKADPVKVDPPKNTDTGGVKTTPPVAKAIAPHLDPSHPLNKERSVYFDLDSNVVKDEYRSMLQAHAKYLVENPSLKIRVEGNTDERGTREYNLALGSRRGDAVKKVLNVLGVGESRIEVVSFGKEKPKAQGSDESSWAQNRRADIAYE